jgi:chemotaxis protein histidine kinase CheA
VGIDNESIQARLAALRRSYARGLPQRVAVLEAGWQALSAAPQDSAALELFIRQCHTLAGAGTTFGLPELTELARALERRLREVEQGAHAFDEATRGFIADMLAQISAFARHAAAQAAESRA